jgi:hypothetical protein
MTTICGMRDIARNSNILDGYDYIDIEDKKTHEYKGLLVSAKYADEIKQFLDTKIQKEQQQRWDSMQEFVGAMEIEEQFRDLDAAALKEAVAKAKGDL